nr:MAG TPA: hypothetical protein [Siphoviridae sp. ctngg6]
MMGNQHRFFTPERRTVKCSVLSSSLLFSALLVFSVLSPFWGCMPFIASQEVKRASCGTFATSKPLIRCYFHNRSRKRQ